jgi:hypothetical protein
LNPRFLREFPPRNLVFKPNCKEGFLQTSLLGGVPPNKLVGRGSSERWDPYLKFRGSCDLKRLYRIQVWVLWDIPGDKHIFVQVYICI